MLMAAQKRYEVDAEAERLGSISAKRSSRALVSELPRCSYGRLHVTVVTVTRDGACKTISGVHFERGAYPLWVP